MSTSRTENSQKNEGIVELSTMPEYPAPEVTQQNSEKFQGLKVKSSNKQNGNNSIEKDKVQIQKDAMNRSFSLRQSMDVRKLKFMRLSEFLVSAEIQVDQKMNPTDPVIYFFQIASKLQKEQDQEHIWLIRRRYQDLVTFDRQVRKELKKKKMKKQLPDLPFSKEPKNQNPEQILNFLEAYLKAMITLEDICNTGAFWQFIEISDYNHEGIVKVKEGYYKKRNGGRFKQRNCCSACINPFNSWRLRYFVITSEGIMYSLGHKLPQTQIREMLLFDHNFEIKYGKFDTGRLFGVALVTTSRRLVMEASDLFHFVDLIASIKEAMRLSPYVELHRYDSFAPIRQKATCKWYIDGQGYYEELMEKLNQATKEVFITDWWLSPEMYLMRPVGKDQNQDSRFDRILQKIAQKGVKIYILVYREPTIALNMNSNYTKQVLCALHPNIRIMRHPNAIIPLLWSHHEKMVVIDQAYGFMGGLDICYGRWDTQKHPLTDTQPRAYLFPGIDYSNVRIKDFQDVTQCEVSDINRWEQPRMPWHDIAMMVTGEPVRDLTRHFIQYWNFAKVDIYSKDSKEKLDSLVPGLENKEKSDFKSVVKDYWNRMRNKFGFNKKEEGEEDSVDLESSMIESNSKQVNKPNFQYNAKKKQQVSASLDFSPSDRNNMNPFGIQINETTATTRNQQNQQLNFTRASVAAGDSPNKSQRSQSIIGDKQDFSKVSRFSAYLEKLKEEIENANMEESIMQSKLKLKLKSTQQTKVLKEEESEKENSFDSKIYDQDENQKRYGDEQLQSMESSKSIECQEFIPDGIDLSISSVKSIDNMSLNNDSEQIQQQFKSLNDTTQQTNQESNNKQQPSNKNQQKENSNHHHHHHHLNNNTHSPKKIEEANEFNKTKIQIPILEKLKRNYEEEESINACYIIKQQQQEQLSTIPSYQSAQSSQGTVNSQQQTSPENRNKQFMKKENSFNNNNNNNSNKNNTNQLTAKQIQLMQNRKSHIPSSTQDPSGMQSTRKNNFRKQQNQQAHRNTVWEMSSHFFKIFKKSKNPPDGDYSNSNDSDSSDYRKREEEGSLNEPTDGQQLLLDRIALDNSQFKKTGSCKCQMVRSSSGWSLGLGRKNHEMSIQLAYIDLITSSQNFIYIENQFFISCSAGSKVKNLIAQALIDRIKLAADNQQSFKVIVVMPLLPGFEGEVNDSGAGVMKCQLHWEYATISRGGTSIIEELSAHPSIKNPSDYIQFYGLRQHDIIDERPVSEIIYVHSKLMIVDDNFVIMGSANINDRSLLGTRDSEIAMIIEDTQKVFVRSGSRVKRVGKFSYTLRNSIFQEHFGLTEQQAIDPLSEQTSSLISQRAKVYFYLSHISLSVLLPILHLICQFDQRNTEIYREVFACYPDDMIDNLDMLDSFREKAQPQKYVELKNYIIGHAVELPLYFLKKENMNFSISQKEYFVPDENFL